MAVSESAKHDLYQELERILGKERAETFMDMVTTVPWSEVATKSDIQALRSEMAARTSGLATKSDVRAEVERMGRRMIMWGASMMVTLAVLAFTAGRAIPS